MSDTVTPDKQEIVRELYSRRNALDPQKRAVVEELAARMGLSQTQPLPGTLAQRQQASKEQFDKNVPTTAQSLGINSNLPGEVLGHAKWLGSTLLNTEPEANDPTFKNPA